QLFELERLDDIVVRTGGQPLDLVLPVAAGGKNENRKGTPHAAQFTDKIQPVHARQAQIDDGDIMVVLLSSVTAFLRTGHGVDNMPCLGKTRRQVVAQQRFVFDQQELHLILR